MGQTTGNYGTNLFPSSRRKQYVKIQKQQGKPEATPDGNDDINLTYENLRNFIEKTVGSAAFIDDAFKVVADGANNDFQVSAGSGWVNGQEAYSALSARYLNDGSTYEEKNLHSVSTDLAAEVLTDTAMNWAVNELAGRSLVPNIQDGTGYTVVSNTATTITVTGGSDMTTVAEAGDSYLLSMTTPSGSGRTDTVWLNFYLDEIDATEDPDLLHNLGSGIEIDRRFKARTIIQVEQGTAAYADYTDLDNNYHWLVKIGTITRVDGQDAINAIETVDERSSTGSGVGGPGARTVVVSSNDTTPGHLTLKMAEGSGISFTVLNPGANEVLQIASTLPTAPGELVYKGASYNQLMNVTTDNAVYTYTSSDVNLASMVTPGHVPKYALVHCKAACRGNGADFRTMAAIVIVTGSGETGLPNYANGVTMGELVYTSTDPRISAGVSVTGSSGADYPNYSDRNIVIVPVEDAGGGVYQIRVICGGGCTGTAQPTWKTYSAASLLGYWV